MKNYGMPYKGSKNAIAEMIVDVMPCAENFYDLFGGGGAISHCAALSGKWDRVIYNELEPLVANGFKMAVNGEFADEKRWISREDFQRLKDTDPYAAICFSFGNNLKNYAYEPNVERFKKHLHVMFTADTVTERRLAWKGFVREFRLVREEIAELTQKGLELCKECGVTPVYNADGSFNAGKVKNDVFKAKSADIRGYMRAALEKSGKTQADVDKYLGNQMSGHYFGTSQWALPTAEQYARLKEILPGLTKDWSELNESLERLERLESLERLERLQSLECYNKSYEEIEIKEDSVIYCDIPYKGTDKYLSEFGYDKFYKWASEQDALVFISGYAMPEDEFVAVWAKNKVCTLSSTNRTKTVEKLFMPRRQFEEYKGIMVAV